MGRAPREGVEERSGGPGGAQAFSGVLSIMKMSLLWLTSPLKAPTYFYEGDS